MNNNFLPVSGSSVTPISDYQILYQELLSQHQFMMSQISHEIRNPVTLINSFLQILGKQHPELTSDDCWNKIMENMDFLKSLLSDFSQFNNSSRTALQETSILQLFHDIFDSVTPTYNNLGIELILNKETAIPTILADKTKIRQLILNLLRNAREAIGTNGKIICTLKSDGSSVTITIQDTGPGIPDAYQKDLFEPFITHKQEGTGLGLAICKRIAEAHEGSISFSSIPEKGTEFTVVLPVK